MSVQPPEWRARQLLEARARGYLYGIGAIEPWCDDRSEDQVWNLIEFNFPGGMEAFREGT